MSGGFFRGTSADQDTRFSNKQAKLLKTQKFAPELDHLVDTSKVKMDVMKPWIAKRVTELLGFEDEVLINFIYGLLEEKEADGKKIQIQLTGFMEKNTVKFMRELWTLLLSAQQNASGVPQQFLDEKEAEIQQKKAEDDRIAQEIQKKREMEENDSELVKNKVMDGDAGNSRSYGDPVGSALNSTNFNTEEEKNNDFKRSLRAKNRGSRRSRSISLSPRARQRSISPRNNSRSPPRRSHSIDRHHRSSWRSTSPRRSISPRRHSPRSTPSISRRRSPYSRRGSPSLSRYPSPFTRRRSPLRRKSPSSGPLRSLSPRHRRSPARVPRRSPSPASRRSPVRRRFSPGRRTSPSPVRRRPRSPSPGRRRPRSPSPGRRRPRSPSPRRRRPRSPSPGRRRPRSPSPGRRRLRSPSPGRRRPRSPSPGRRRPRSPSPGRRRPRSPSPGRRRPRSPSPGRRRPWSRSPIRRQSPSPKRQRTSPSSPKTRSANRPLSPEGRSPYNSRSPNRSRQSLSKDTEKETNGTPSVKDRVVHSRGQEQKSDDNNRDGARIVGNNSPDSEHRLSKSLRPPNYEERNSTRDSSYKNSDKPIPSQGSTDTSGDEEHSRARENARKANSCRRKTKDLSAGLQPKKISAGDSSPRDKSPFILQQSGKVVQKKHPDQLSESSEDELAGRRTKHQTDSPDDSRRKQHSPTRIENDESYSKGGRNSEHVMRGLRDDSDDAIDTKKYLSKVNEDSQSDDGSPLKKTKKKTDGNRHIDSGSSGSEEPDKHRTHSEKRRHKKTHKHKKQYDDSSESDSEPDGKDAKRRRRKEEKRLRKEERRRRREERHRRRAERHASKRKLKNTDTVTMPSDSEKDRDSDSDGDVRKRVSNAGREESDQKKLEIELREKALESLRAKKAINN
uniref:PWI domain-containing protein n=1 Tax=Zea mays TaxID=4577 RepID=A0A804LHT5_MAIZE